MNLNYHHLLYFWMVAREGSVVGASEKLFLSPSTISGQVHALEDAMDVQLFERAGRSLVMTDMGRLVYGYADEIFGLGRELLNALQGQSTERPLQLNIGIADVVPKLVAQKLLEPALHIDEEVHIVCREDKPNRLLADLALHELDVVLMDEPVGPQDSVKAYNHLLGECGVCLFGAEGLAEKYGTDLPQCLDGAPFLLPMRDAYMRRSLEEWFDAQKIRPRVVGEFEDSALMKVFGQNGLGVFPVPTVIAKDVERQYGVRRLCDVGSARERFYAISVERKLKHPGVVAISEAARRTIFAEDL